MGPKLLYQSFPPFVLLKYPAYRVSESNGLIAKLLAPLSSQEDAFCSSITILTPLQCSPPSTLLNTTLFGVSAYRVVGVCGSITSAVMGPPSRPMLLNELFGSGVAVIVGTMVWVAVEVAGVGGTGVGVLVEVWVGISCIGVDPHAEDVTNNKHTINDRFKYRLPIVRNWFCIFLTLRFMFMIGLRQSNNS